MNNGGKLLILGASSFVGQHLWKQLGPQQAIGTYNRNPISHGTFFDSLSMRVGDIIDDPSDIRAAVILLGDTHPDSCADDAAISRALNVRSVLRTLDDLSELDIPPIFTSSEFVFDGERGDYEEADVAEPILLYGHQKLEVERYMQDRGGRFCILRLAKVYGEEPGDGTIISGFIDAVQRGNHLKCASDQRFSPVYVGDVCDAILEVTEREINGLFHLGGPSGLSRFECLEQTLTAVRKYQQVELEIETCSIRDFRLFEPRPVDVSMNSSKLVAATGLRLRRFNESCAAVAFACFEGETIANV
ncbi:MAG: dTDP-4-dehydrorhamnose reductase [Alphaproteobacteria bacterium MarineAlpha4_Bin2]|nr:MAG: dTDP-4-dehydrorhamnose reductase [Alphaproteobacteria bacterium MarineAlpha4_Bin2]